MGRSRKRFTSGVRARLDARRAASILLALVFSLAFLPRLNGVAAQTQAPAGQTNEPAPTAASPFRLESISVGSDAELLTVFGSLKGLRPDAGAGETDTPLVSVLRDTLGDTDPENDRLRYVWPLSYTRPSAVQRVASAVPFLYTRVGGKKRAGKGELPPAVIDLSATGSDVWNRFMWLGLQNLLFNPYGILVKSATSAYDRNTRAYKQAHVIRALAILSLYESQSGTSSVFTPGELREIQARLMLTDKIFGGIVDDAYLERYYHNQTVAWRDTRGHNWELLRQRAEVEGLYFEPLPLPDGETMHALLWVAREDLAKNRARKFNGRFLNFGSPWTDNRLARWRGHTERRYFDAENRPVARDAPGARAVELIPLALYGLEHPKIPIMLVDFRDGGNPKRREMSRRILEDVTRNVLAVSKFGDIHYFLGRTVLDIVTGRRGMDMNQPTRLRAYAQLKLLLSLNASLDPGLREEISDRFERVSLNPLENDLEAEADFARTQYAALLDYARRAGGLAAKIERDRRAELVPLEHGRFARSFFRTANVISLGLYRHREDVRGPELRNRLDEGRRLAFHRRYLREVSKSTPLVEVAWDIEDVRRSLRFIAEQGARADAKTAAAAARIFARTEDDETRRLCLNSLYRINNETAKNELLRIYQSPAVDQQLRLLSADYLRMAVREEQRIKPADARIIASAIGQ
ncbi:MAG TPA: hypothetical protein VF240_12315 [Pyrinomonadaceae bacterium]